MGSGPLKGRSWLVGLAGLLLALLIWDMGRFAGALEEKSRSDREDLPHVDLIAVLTGGQGRLREALDLLESGHGRALLISGTSSSLDAILEANNVQDWPQFLKDQIYLDPESQRTFDNARQIRRRIELLEARSVLVVTSNYHMRRSLRLIQEELAKAPPLTVQLHSFAVTSPNFDPERWWRSSAAWRIFFSEYIKSWWTPLQSRFGA